MDKLQADKLTEIRKALDGYLRRSGYSEIARFKDNAPEYVSYLLQLVETQAQRIESLNEESMSNFRAAHERGKEIKRLYKALEDQKKSFETIHGIASERFETPNFNWNLSG